MSTTRIVLLIIAATTLVRVWLASVTGLGFDESYMLGNARQFLWGYVDQVPMHLWMAGAARVIFGSEASGFVRLPFVLMFAGSSWLMYRLTARLFSERAGLWAVIAFNAAPVFSLAHASWILADGPLIFFLLASANAVAAALFDDQRSSSGTLWWWLLAGLMAGCALLSKYSAAFFILAVFATLLTVGSLRRHLATPGPWLAAVVAFLVFLPVLLWNMSNDYIGFAFQTRRVGSGFNIATLAEMIGGELAYLGPWLAIPFLISLLAALRRGPGEARGWYLALAAAGPIVFFTAAAATSRGLPHWPMPGWLFTIPLFARDAAELVLRRPRFARGYMAVSAAVMAILVVAFAWQATRGGIIPRAIVAENPVADPTLDLITWTELKDALEVRGLMSEDAVFASPIWMTAGKTSYALGPDVPVVCVCDNPQHFPYRYDQTQWAGRDVVVIVPSTMPRLWGLAEKFFDRMDAMEPVPVHRNGEEAFLLELRMGRNMQFPAGFPGTLEK